MEKSVCIVTAIINCIVAVVVITLSITEQMRHQQTKSLCDIIYSPDDVYVNCAVKKLVVVPKLLPANSTILDFTRNSLSEITDESFGDLYHLLELNLQLNEIRNIEKNSFCRLPRLRVLILRYNNLNFSYEALPVGVFSPLTHLKQLFLDSQSIDKNWSYPEMTFLDLKNIEYLTLDYPTDSVFGNSFSQMIHLKYLSLNIDLPAQIHKNTFNVFSVNNIHTLEILKLHTTNTQMDNMSLRFFDKLQVLTLEKLDSCFSLTLESFKSLSGKNMTQIELKGSNFGFGGLFNKCNMVLTSNDTRYLTAICVEKVLLRNYGFKFIQNDTFTQEPFAGCLRYLDLSQNCILGTKDFSIQIQSLRNLESLEITSGECKKIIEMASSYYSTGNKTSGIVGGTDDTTDLRVSDIFVNCHGGVIDIDIPPKLTTLILKSVFKDISIDNCIIRVHGAESLIHVDISLWNLKVSLTKISGLKNVKFLNYTYNPFLPYVFNLTFIDMKNIETLVLKTDMVTLPTFYYDLSMLFSNLKHIILYQCGIQFFPLVLEQIFNLSTIDLSHNSISYLEPQTRRTLDQTVKEGRNVTLNLDGNILKCGCASFRFVTWMMETDVQFEKLYHYRCRNETGDVINMAEVFGSYLKHWRKCHSSFWLAFAVIISFLLVTGLAVGVMVDKNSLRLKCLFLQWFGLKFRAPKREDFKYDIFVYYSSKDDYRWVCNTFREKMEEERGLRLCIPDRDFIPGACTAEEILEAIHNSWKTVVYMTEVFLEDELCSFTLSSAVYACTNDMPNRLILLYSNEIFNQPLPQIVTQLLDGDDNFMLEELEERGQWDILYDKTLEWV